MGLMDLSPDPHPLEEKAERHHPGRIRTHGGNPEKRRYALSQGDLIARLPDQAYGVLAAAYEPPISGGFGSPPKFPMPHQLLFLLRYGKGKGEERAIAMAVKTLRHAPRRDTTIIWGRFPPLTARTGTG